MPLRLIYRAQTTVPVEVEGITPDVVREKSISEIEKLTVFHGNVKTALAEFFQVSGDSSDERIDWEGELAGVHWIGARMKSGRMYVHGNGGRHIGSEMSGGEIHVEGDAGDWVGGELHGGLIRVRGRAGHLVGAAYRGSARGMRGGTILIDGDAGNEIGHTIRRGLIAIGGNIGDLAGFNMLAGTLLIFGESGIRPGAGMKRGTIGFLGPNAPDLLPTFQFGCRYEPDFLPLMFRHLHASGFTAIQESSHTTVELYHGDMIEGGRGEILVGYRTNGRPSPV